jgi:hypothetical protein
MRRILGQHDELGAVGEQVSPELAFSGISGDFDGFFCGESRLDSSSRRLTSFAQRPDQEDGREGGNDNGSPSGRYLFLGGIRGPYLGVQIAGVMLVGFGFACGVVFGLIRAFDDPDRDRRRLGWAVASLCVPPCLTFYGWGWLGHPLAFCGLR